MRASLGIAAILQGTVYLMDQGEHPTVIWIGALVAVTCGACLLIGFGTPFAGTVLGLGAATLAFFGGEAKQTVWFAVTISMSIACLGPGAFSVDARLFGRREIIISPIPRNKEE